MGWDKTPEGVKTMTMTPAEKALKIYTRLEIAVRLIHGGGEEILQIFNELREKPSAHKDTVFWDEWLSRVNDLTAELLIKRDEALRTVMQLTAPPSRPVEVTSDGQKVWVNIGGMCGARFSHRSYEVTSVEPNVSQTILAKGEFDGKAQAQAWRDFKALVLQHHKVVVEEKHRPDWVPVDTK